jgi:predicted ATP-dependent serine protease
MPNRTMNITVGIRGLKPDSQLTSIEVPEMLRERIDTGINWLNDVYGGKGLTPSTITMFSGESGAGKTTSSLLLADSLQRKGHIVLFNTAEESLYQTKMVAERLRLKCEFYVGQSHKVPDFIKQADHLRKKCGPQSRFIGIIDSLQAMDDGFYKNGIHTGNTSVRAMDMLTNWVKDVKSIKSPDVPTLILLSQVTKTGEFEGKNVILHACDIRTHIRLDNDPNSESFGYRIMECFKNRFGLSGKKVVLDMRDNGLVAL